MTVSAKETIIGVQQKKSAPKGARRTDFNNTFKGDIDMNYIGLIFSFMIPGMIVGGMAASLIGEAARRARREAKKH